MTLDTDYLEALLQPMAIRNSRMCSLAPRMNMATIKRFASNSHELWKHSFFVHIDSASVEDSCIPTLQSRWGKGISIRYLSIRFQR